MDKMNWSNVDNETIMNLGVKQAAWTMRNGFGGPFGAVVVDSEGTLVSVASNTVLRDNDPTAHAEVNAIREACKALNTHDLTGCTLYATGYPCPMCLSAIIWANIKKVYFGCTPKDADAIGFRDDFIYDYINGGCKDAQVLDLEELNREECLKLFEEYSRDNREMY